MTTSDENAPLPGPGPSGLVDADLNSMIARAADAHFNPSNPSSAAGADLPPAIAEIRNKSADEVIRQINKMPLFMTELDETGSDDESPNEALEAIKALQYEGSDEDVAKNFKEQGNECFKAKAYKDARQYYTKALKVKFENKELEVSLLNNRAMCNLNMGNYGKCVADCRRSLQLVSKSDKPWFRAAKALLALDKLDEAEACIQNALILNPNHTEINNLAKKIQQRKDYLAKLKAEQEAREAERKREEAMMKIALEARNISHRRTEEQQNPLAGDYKIRFAEKDDPRTPLLFPTMLVYYTPGIDLTELVTARSDLIAGFPETVRIQEQLMEVLGDQMPWDEKRDYRPGNVECYMETKTGGLVKVGQRVSLLEALSNEKVEIVDGLVVIYVVTKRWTGEFIGTWKLQKMRGQ